jgi:formate-dependent nitrite reductase membrane component NrfD
VKKEYRPMALGFWGIGLPLVLFGIFFCRTAAERATILLIAAVFGLVGAFIYRAKE